MKRRANLLIYALEGTLMLNNGINEHGFRKDQTAYVKQGGAMRWSTSDDASLISESFLKHPLNHL